MKKILVIVLSAFSILSAQNSPLSLKEAMDFALNNNNKLKQYNEKVIQKEFKVKEANGNFLPTVNLSASYNHLNDPIVFDLEPVRQAMITLQANNQLELFNINSVLAGRQPLGISEREAYLNTVKTTLNGKLPLFRETLKEQNYLQASITAVQPIFLGGKLFAARNYAEDELSSTQLEFKQAKNEVIADVIQSYITVVFLQDVVKLREDVLNAVRQHRNKAEKLFKEGLIANYNLMRAEVALSDAEKNLESDKTKLETAILALKNAAGIEQTEKITITSTLSMKEIGESLENFLADSKSNLPLLQILKLKLDAAQQNYSVLRSAFLPQIAAFGKYELYPEFLSTLEPRWVIGLQASINLFNGMKDASALESNSHLEQEIEYMEKDISKKIDLLLNKNYLDMKDAKQRYERGVNSVTFAKENLRLNEKRFETGLGTSIEVIDAHVTLEKSLLDNTNALYDYYKALLQLFTNSGSPERLLNYWN